MYQQELKRSTTRVKRASTRFLQILMAVFAAIFLFAGVAFNRGMMLPCFLMAALYFVFEFFAHKTYTYILSEDTLSVEVVYGGRFRRQLGDIDLTQLVVLAPHDDPAVDRYRKGAQEGSIRKYDYTSYDDSVPYYTMIVDNAGTKEKYLLDLNEAMLGHIRRRCPQKVVGI